jgi:hypothetical protein
MIVHASPPAGLVKFSTSLVDDLAFEHLADLGRPQVHRSFRIVVIGAGAPSPSVILPSVCGVPWSIDHPAIP